VFVVKSYQYDFVREKKRKEKEKEKRKKRKEKKVERNENHLCSLVTEGVSPIFDFPPQRIKNNNSKK
jgi:hypothetical protein